MDNVNAPPKDGEVAAQLKLLLRYCEHGEPLNPQKVRPVIESALARLSAPVPDKEK